MIRDWREGEGTRSWGQHARTAGHPGAEPGAPSQKRQRRPIKDQTRRILTKCPGTAQRLRAAAERIRHGKEPTPPATPNRPGAVLELTAAQEAPEGARTSHPTHQGGLQPPLELPVRLEQSGQAPPSQAAPTPPPVRPSGHQAPKLSRAGSDLPKLLGQPRPGLARPRRPRCLVALDVQPGTAQRCYRVTATAQPRQC